MSTKESSTDKKMPLPPDEVREKLLNPDFLNPSSLPDTSDDKPLKNYQPEVTIMTKKNRQIQ